MTTEPIKKNLSVVLVRPRNPLNIGAVARAMSNFGFSSLRVVQPYEKAYREAKSAVGAETLLRDSIEYETLAEAIADCTLVVGTTSVGHREMQHPLRPLRAGANLLRKRASKSSIGLLFGSEKWGLSNEELSFCHWLVQIPTRKEHRSMNLSQAVAVCLYELSAGTQKSAAPEKVPAARAETVDRVTGTLLKALYESGYINPRSENLSEEKLRRLVRRLTLNQADAEVVLGMLHKILWKLNQPEK